MEQLKFTETVRIRHAVAGDVRELGAALWFGKNAAPDARVDTAFFKYWDEKYLGALCALPGCAFIVAHDAETIIGLALASVNLDTPRRAKLSRFCLLPSYKGRGIESRLLDECETSLPASIEQIITCISTNDDEQRQIFDANGFAPVGMLQMGGGAQKFCQMAKVLTRHAPIEKPSPLGQLAKQSPIHRN